MDIKVLYEDNHVIAVYKPAGVLVQAGDGGPDDDTLYWQVKLFIKERDRKPGNVFLGILHRLDRPVSGVVLFAKTSKGAARLSEQIRERTIQKTYHALVVGHVENGGMLRDFITKDEAQKKAIIISMDDLSVQADEAILGYEVINSNSEYSLLKIKLETGRFHQIRAQLSHMGHPVVGDVKYLPAGKQMAFNPARPDKSICLSATELKFMGATDGAEHTVSIDIPSDWPKV